MAKESNELPAETNKQPSETFNNFSFKLNSVAFLLSNACIVGINNRNIKINPDNPLEIARNNENVLWVRIIMLKSSQMDLPNASDSFLHTFLCISHAVYYQRLW